MNELEKRVKEIEESIKDMALHSVELFHALYELEQLREEIKNLNTR